MLFAVRCFTCNACLPADAYEAERLQGVAGKRALDALGVRRMCCRRMLMTHPPALEDSLLHYPAVDQKEPDLFLDIRCLTSAPRTIGCD